jgi:hypothetical protein
MLTEPINEFILPGGTIYEINIWKMFQHQIHAKLLGSKFGKRMCYNQFKQNDGVIVAEMDYSERYQPIPMPVREMQSENLEKDADVSMEIRIVSLQDKDMSW